MIYFQLSVRPLFDPYDPQTTGRYHVDALFNHDDARDSLLLLEGRLRDDGWTLCDIQETKAIPSYTDLSQSPRLSLLHRQAQKEGLAYRMSWSEGSVAV